MKLIAKLRDKWLTRIRSGCSEYEMSETPLESLKIPRNQK